MRKLTKRHDPGGIDVPLRVTYPSYGFQRVGIRSALLFGLTLTMSLAASVVAIALTSNTSSRSRGDLNHFASATVATSVPSSTTTQPMGPDQSPPAEQIPGGSTPNAAGFNSVTCVTPSECVAVGATNNGAALAAVTSDGGTSWSFDSLPSGVGQLNAVDCADSTDCVAVGAGSALTSNDGGVNWTIGSLSLVDATFLGVACPAVHRCVAVGVTPNPRGPYGAAIIESNNGGSSWQSASLPSETLGVGSVACPTSNECIAVGATILTSTDGGMTWGLGTVAGGIQAVRSLSCSSAQVCVAVGANAVGTSDPTAGATAIATIDGGTTWNTESLPGGSSGIDEISCGSADDCVAIGAPLSGSGPLQMISSTDGGQTWGSVVAPSISDAASLSCTQGPSCVVVGGSSTSGPTSASSSNANDPKSWSVSTAISEGNGQ